MRGPVAMPASVLLISTLLAAACVGTVAPTPEVTPVPIPSATPVVLPTATSAPTPVRATPQPPTAQPPTPQPTPSPLRARDLLISYVHASLRDTCAERDDIASYDEVVSITCGPDDLPFDLSLFDNATDMQGAYDADVADAETPPQPDGSCVEGNYEEVYGFEDGRSGRINCREHTGSTGAQYHVLEWTNEELLVIGYISNRADLHTWDELYDFWVDFAGPFPPD